MVFTIWCLAPPRRRLARVVAARRHVDVVPVTDEQLSFLRAVVACWLADRVTNREAICDHLDVSMDGMTWGDRGHELVGLGLALWSTDERARLQPTARGIAAALMLDPAQLRSRSVSYDVVAEQERARQVGLGNPPSLKHVELLLDDAHSRHVGSSIRDQHTHMALFEVRALIRGGW